MLGREMASAAMNGVAVVGRCSAGAVFNGEACLALGAFKTFLPTSYYSENGLSPQPSPSHLGVIWGSQLVGLSLMGHGWVDQAFSALFLLDPFQVWGSLASSTLSKTARIMWPASTNHGHSFHSLSPYPLEIAISEAWVCSQCFFFLSLFVQLNRNL